MTYENANGLFPRTLNFQCFCSPIEQSPHRYRYNLCASVLVRSFSIDNNVTVPKRGSEKGDPKKLHKSYLKLTCWSDPPFRIPLWGTVIMIIMMIIMIIMIILLLSLISCPILDVFIDVESKELLQVLIYSVAETSEQKQSAPSRVLNSAELTHSMWHLLYSYNYSLRTIQIWCH